MFCSQPWLREVNKAPAVSGGLPEGEGNTVLTPRIRKWTKLTSAAAAAVPDHGLGRVLQRLKHRGVGHELKRHPT
jgi:hypothetical protein